jgi:hypothetical protein
MPSQKTVSWPLRLVFMYLARHYRRQLVKKSRLEMGERLQKIGSDNSHQLVILISYIQDLSVNTK